jgi:hypothetical protein
MPGSGSGPGLELPAAVIVRLRRGWRITASGRAVRMKRPDERMKSQGWIRAAGAIAALMMLFCSAPVLSQPAGWAESARYIVTNASGSEVADYQLRLVIDTQTLIAEGRLQALGEDLRFGGSQDGDGFFPHWIESGINTNATVVWVRLPLLAAEGATPLWRHIGNPAAADVSTIEVFDFVDLVANSATNQVFGGATGGVTTSQRGFRFRPNEDVLLVALGKAEPNGTTRFVTLFDVATQAKLIQGQVSGPPATYSYASVAQPLWLREGQEYILTLYQNETDGYYFGPALPQINARLSYLDMRYCNSCTQDTFPTNFLNNIHYGYPDFLLRSRKQLTPLPGVFDDAIPTSLDLLATPDPVEADAPLQLQATVSGGAPGGVVDFEIDGAPVCSSVPLVDGIAACDLVAEFDAGGIEVVARYAGDEFHLGSEAAIQVQVTPVPPGAPVDLIAVPADAAIALDFEPPARDGGVPILSYRGVCESDFQSNSLIRTASPILIAGLDNGVDYRCRVYARNSVGEGPSAEAPTVRPPDDRLFVDGFEDNPLLRARREDGARAARVAPH